jgi:hypothetical protein
MNFSRDFSSLTFTQPKSFDSHRMPPVTRELVAQHIKREDANKLQRRSLH